MAYLNGRKVLSVVQVKEILVDNTIEVTSLDNSKVLGTTLAISTTPILNKVINDILYSFNSSVSNNTLTTATATISNHTVTI